MSYHNHLSPPDKRRTPRRRSRNATTLFGEVFDLSAGGMQVFRKGALLIEVGDELVVDLHCEHLSAAIPVRVVRRECVGFRRHVYGVEFVGIDDGLRAKLDRMIDVACEPCVCPSCWLAA